MKQSQRPLLSIGMIFKNEERCLERCLDSLEPLRKALPCELVMADTGSEDHSREIAARYADVLFDFPWTNSFAAARNAVLERCSGLWYLCVDADEWLDGDFTELTALLKGGGWDMASVRIRNYRFQNDLTQFVEIRADRLLRLDTGARYFNEIHENFGRPGMRKKLLERTVLHHDGYRDDRPLAEREAKLKRNMELLRRKLERDPHNIHTLVECVESSLSNQEAKEYIRQGLEAENGGTADEYLPSFYRHAVRIYAEEKETDRALALLEEGMRKCPGSILLRVDGEGFALLTCHMTERWEESVVHGLRWRQGVEDFRAGRYDRKETLFGAPLDAERQSCGLLELTLFLSLTHLSRWEEAQASLERMDLDVIDEGNMTTFAWSVLQGAGHLSAPEIQLERLWAHGKGRGILLSVLRQGGASLSDAALAATAAMGDCDPGRSARARLCTSADGVSAELAGIERWDEVLPAGMARALELGAPFPDSFYAQSAEQLAQRASELSEWPELGRVLATRAPVVEAGETPARLIWALDMVAAALRVEKWENAETGQALCELFAARMDQCLHLLYQPALLCGEHVNVLPGLHRFGWYYLEARRRLERGDEAGYIRLLRVGLETAPAMKGMVSFLIGQLERREAEKRKTKIIQATPELLTLAGQVRDILAAYPPGDPAVLALKQSEAYQKVAFLIEEPAAR